MIANSCSTTQRRGRRAIFGLAIIALVSGVVAGCGGASGRKPTGRWELVALAGNASNRATQSLPTQIGSEIEFLKKGNLAITGGETNLGTLQYSFPDETHLMIESSTGLQEVVAYTLADNVLSLDDSALTLTLKPYKELEPTAANLAGAWSIPVDSRGEQADSVPLGSAVSDLLSAALGGETEKQERCLVTDRREVSILGSASYSPTLIDFGPDKTFTMQDRFSASWQGQFDVTGSSLTATADKTPPASAGDPFGAIRANCLIVRLTNAKLTLGSFGNPLQIEYVRSDASSQPAVAESPAAVVELLTPSASTMQGAWMLGGGGNGGIMLNEDGTGTISGWGLGASVMGMVSYPATYRVDDNMLYITIEEGADTPPSTNEIVLTVTSLTTDTLTLSGEQTMTVFNVASPVIFNRPY